jgi:hypothetical protein
LKKDFRRSIVLFSWFQNFEATASCHTSDISDYHSGLGYFLALVVSSNTRNSMPIGQHYSVRSHHSEVASFAADFFPSRPVPGVGDKQNLPHLENALVISPETSIMTLAMLAKGMQYG